MKPVIALVGRPNVGKSTLFNCLTRSQDALVANYPGLTRDRKYGDGQLGGQGYLVVDTGGLTGNQSGIEALMQQQAQQAIAESNAVLFLLDAREGLTAADEMIAQNLRRSGKPVFTIVNKIDGLNAETVINDFYALGLGEPLPIAASHGRGVDKMINIVLAALPQADAAAEEAAAPGIRIAMIGRPNVGKSTLLNRMIGEERVLVYDQPGTTRDSIFIPFERDGEQYTLIDTAGIRRRGKVYEAVEKFSVIKSLQAIAEAHVVFLVLDASEGLTDQDMSLMGDVLEQGRALVLVVNKWDGLSEDQRASVKSELERRLGFLDFAETHFISALHGSGVGLLFEASIRAYKSAMRNFTTPKLTELLEEALYVHQPPLVRGHRIKLRYAHQGGKNPPLIVIHGNQVERVPDDYKRYLAHFFRKKLKLKGTPVLVQFKSGDNPYKDKRNTLTPRQIYKRRRMLKRTKK
ncbi:MAG TPA: ribosome biogenesis GTPase Der [Gammaproteobacteria bacterium]|nr:ribosome biogenesis GTPase Der [Gammaproteobacteria bacterium]